MSKIDRFNGDVKAFASEYQGTERTTFGTTVESDELTQQQTSSYLRGWGIVGPSEDPSLEDFNAAMFTATQYIAYLHQMGVPEWNALQEYPTEGAQVTHSLRSWLRGPDWASGDEPGVADSTRWKSVVLNEDLGTAAFADMATSITDTDESKAQGVGYLGYGLNIPTDGDQISDFDTLDLSAYGDGAKLWFGSGATGQPDGLSLFGKVELEKFSLATSSIRLNFTGIDRTFTRRYNSGTWQAWVEELNSSNAGTAAYVNTGTGFDQVATNGEMGQTEKAQVLSDWDDIDFPSLVEGQVVHIDTGSALNVPTDVSSYFGNIVVTFRVSNKGTSASFGAMVASTRLGKMATIKFESGVFTGLVAIYSESDNATSSQINTGTSTDTVVTPSGLAGSSFVEQKMNASGSAPMYACRAWVNFDGTGTVSIRASGNVSSISDGGTGNYTVNFITSMPDANYSAPCSASRDTFSAPTSVTSYNASNVNVRTFVTNGEALVDLDTVSLSIFR